jgi:hypothetical protein
MLDQPVGGAGGAGDRVDVAILLDGETLDRLAGLGDALDDLAGPARLDADDDDAGDVRIGAGADQRAEMQLQVGAELQAAIGVRDGQRALDVVGDSLRRRIGQVVHRQDDDVVADAHAAVLAAPAFEGGVPQVDAHRSLFLTSAWS